MKPERYVGSSLSNLATQTSVFWRPIHVFVLLNENDDIGRLLADAFSFRQIIAIFPAVRNAVVVSASEICGEMFFRIKVPTYTEDVQPQRLCEGA